MELVIDRLTKRYGDTIAVDRVTFTFSRGVYGLLGANGAGKTTLLRLLCGVLRPEAGTVSLGGMDVQKEAYRDALGYLPQDFGYYPEFTALDFLLYLASLKGLSRPHAKEKAAELLALTDLSSVAKKKIKTFSGGMKQRLGIAQSLLNDPALLVLDEPTAGLDPKERVRFRNLISELGKDRIVLLSTHIVPDVEHIATTIVLMKDGRFLQAGSREEVVRAVEGKVFECETDEAQAQALCKRYPASNLRREGDRVLLRLIADRAPDTSAKPVAPTLEDLYLYSFNEVASGE